jgi:hypothetical protein
MKLTQTQGMALALVLPIFAIAPLFYPGYLQTHSGFVPLWNVADLRANWGNWGWTPHIATTFDPLRSDGLLPYYLAGLLPVSPVVAVKVVLGCGWLLGSVGVFLWLKDWLNPPGALVAALVYTYLPYQIGTIYVRGAWGEALLWGLFPWAIGSLTKEQKDNHLITHHSLLIALLWLLLGLSQLGLTVWVFGLAAAFGLTVGGKQALFRIVAAGVGVGVAGGLLLWLAVPAEPPVPFADHALYPSQLFSAVWGFGASRPGWEDGMSFQLGFAAVGLSILSLFLFAQKEPTERAALRRGLLVFAAATLLSLLPQLGLLPLPFLAETLTYPWQLLGLTGLCLAALAGAALRLNEQLQQPPLFAATLILVILSSYRYLEPHFIQGEEVPPGPQALLGANQVAIVAHDFAVLTPDRTVGLEPQGEMAIPLAVYGPPQANNTLLVNITWQPLQPLGDDLKIFVHLVDAHDTVLAQFDGYPEAPTSAWIPGALIAASYPLALPPDAPSGPYRVFIGLYDEATMARLPTPVDPGGRVIFDVE